MTDSERDPIVLRAIDELRRLPQARPDAIVRVVAAAAAARVTPADEPLMAVRPRRAIAPWLIVGVAAAGLAGVAIRRGIESRAGAEAPVQAVASVPASVPPSMHAVSSADLDAEPLPHQFVYQSAAARRVSVIGDFNSWNPNSARMTRAPGSNLWSVTLPIAPGRHVYGYMVDDSVFMLDPREPKARDPDLGTDGSVIIVGKP